jgi:hypothetical protein
MNNAATRAEMGAHATLFGKYMLAIMAIIVGVVDKDTTQFREKPGATTIELIFAGVVGALAFLFVAKKRGAGDLGKLFGVSVFLFALIQLLTELSGFNSSLRDEKSTAADKIEKLMSKKWFKAFGAFGVFCMFCIAIFARDWPPMNYATQTPLSRGQIALEFLAMGASGGIPALLVVKNRKKKPTKYDYSFNFVVNFVMLMVLHLFLQLSGLYRHIFSSSHGNQ